MGDDGTRLKWSVGVTLNPERTQLEVVDHSEAPVFRVRGYNRLETRFALVGDTKRGRLALWLEPATHARLRELVASMPANHLIELDGTDELWRRHSFGIPLNEDERARIRPLLDEPGPVSRDRADTDPGE